MKPLERVLPGELRARKQWVGARITQRPLGKTDKQPFNPVSGRFARTNEPATWGTFEQACAWRDRQKPEAGVAYAIGFVFTADDPYVGIDLDHCYDERGNLLPWAEPILQKLNSYTEVSVSGKGLHVIVRGKLPAGGRRKGPVEMYDDVRFFVVTGRIHFAYSPEVEERTAELAALHAEVFAEEETVRSERFSASGAKAPTTNLTTNLTDHDLLDRALASRNGDKFERLWTGRWQGLYPSQSEADLALCRILAFWTGNDGERVDALFRQSGLMRPKWDERHFADGRTYGEDRIKMATSGNEVYEGNQTGPRKDVRAWEPEAVAPEEPEWLRDAPGWGAPVAPEEGEEESGFAVETGAEAAALAPDTTNQTAPATNQIAPTTNETNEHVPPLPEYARIDEALGQGACAWLDDYIAYSRWAVPVAYDGFHEGVGLWLMSTVIGRRAVAHLNGPHYGNLSIAFVARSSLHRKTSTVKVGREVLEAAGLAYLLAPSDSTPEAFIKKLADRGPGDWGGLSGVKLLETELKIGFAAQKGWIHNEFGGKLDKISQDTGPMAGFSPLLRELDDCPPRYEYSTTGRGDAVVEGPYVTLLASCTPADLEKHAGRKSALWSNGFWARFALICPPADLRPPVVPSREGERVPPAHLVRGLAEWHRGLGLPVVARTQRERSDGSKFWEVEIAPPPAKAFPLGEGVREAHDNYARALEALAFDLNLAAMDGGYTRLAEKALRVALLLASLSGSERIELRHWARGQAVAERWRRGLHSMYEAVNGGLVSNVELARVLAEEKILRELKKRGEKGASASDVRVSSGMSADTCLDTLKRLAEAGAISVVRVNREKKPVYAVNPES